MQQQFPSTPNPNSPVPLKPPNFTKQAWLLIWAWGLFITLCLLAHGGKLLVPLFPIGSVGVGLFLYFRKPELYIGYAWWLVFLGSLIRRIIDQQSGYVTPGRWGLTGMLVVSISFITFIRYFPRAYRQAGNLPFILSIMSILYAFLAGIIFGKHNIQYFAGLFDWLSPVAFGFHLFYFWQYYPGNSRVISRSFNWGILVMGLYGVYQFLIAPEWERFYLNNISALSFGRPEPLEIRVFSSLGAPQAFAVVMMAGLLLLFGSQEKLRFVASGAGYLSFLLSMARSVWIGWAVSIVTFFPFLKPKFQIRFVVTVLVMAILVVPVVNMEPFSGAIKQRIESLSDTQQDTSFQARVEGYNDALGSALKEVTGQGLGSVGSETALGGADSGILPLFFSFGWVGVIPYIGGLLLLLIQLFQSKNQGQYIFSSVARAIVLGTFAQVWLNNIFSSEFGLILWGFLGIGLASQKYYKYRCSLLR